MYCSVYNKYRKFTKTRTSYTLKKTLTLSIVYSKCSHQYNKNI